jgi:hypothetical protein
MESGKPSRLVAGVGSFPIFLEIQMTRKTFALSFWVSTLLTLSLQIACHDSKDRKASFVATSPDGELPGGIGITHTLTLAPASKSATIPGSLAYQDPLLATEVKIVKSELIRVLDQSCVEGVCSLRYQQTQRYSSLNPSISYQLIGTNGEIWSPGKLSIFGQKPSIPEGFEFAPRWNETVTITLPLADEAGQPLTSAPNLVNLRASDGEILASRCRVDACEIDYTLRGMTTRPVIFFQIETATVTTSMFSVPAQQETFVYAKGEKSFYIGKNTVVLEHGVDYTSSWNRPASAVKILNQKGFSSNLRFDCSGSACVATRAGYSESAANLLTFRVNNDSSQAQGEIDFVKVTPSVRPQSKEIVSKQVGSLTISFVPGVDYISDGNLPATDLSVQAYDPLEGRAGITSTRCESNGTCTASISYWGNQPFTLFKYSLKVGTYQSPDAEIKIIPSVFQERETIEIWDDKGTTFEVVLKPGIDYQTYDGSIATQLSITNLDSGSFPDFPSIDDSNRNQIFSCDSEGTCRAKIMRVNNWDRPALSFKLLTSTGQSNSFRKKVLFKRDTIEIGDSKSAWYIVGEQVSGQEYQKFQLSFQRADYRSAFPAEKLTISKKPAVGLTLNPVGDSISCNEEGVCSLNGHFIAKDGYLEFSVQLSNRYGDGAEKKVRLIDRAKAEIIPILESTPLVLTDKKLFELDLQPNRDYQGELAAKMVLIDAPKSILVDNKSEVECPNGVCRLTLQPNTELISSPLKYKLINESGKESFVQTLRVEAPNDLLLDQTSRVASGFTKVQASVEIPRGFPTSGISYEIIDAERLGISNVERLRTGVLEITLKEALKPGDTIELQWRLKSRSQETNIASLTLMAQRTLTLKEKLTIQAVKRDDPEEGYEVKLTFAEHFEASGYSSSNEDDIRDLGYYFYANDLFALVEQENLLTIKSHTCDQTNLSCTYWLGHPIDNSKALEVRIKGGLEGLLRKGLSVQPGSFTIKFP